MDDAALLAGAGVAAAAAAPPAAAAGAAVMGVFKYNFGKLASGPASTSALIDRSPGGY
jgi:hypothetical protein